MHLDGRIREKLLEVFDGLLHINDADVLALLAILFIDGDRVVDEVISCFLPSVLQLWQ